MLRVPPVVLFARSEPNPCGARPESVAPPCALQERTELLAPVRAPGCVAYGGRLDESSDCRPLLKPLDVLLAIECA
jgi:hypothetical protein